MKGFISLTAAATRESCTMDDLLRLGSSRDLPMYIEGNQFILYPDFFTSQQHPALAIPLTGLLAFEYRGPIRLSAGAIGIVRDKGSVTTRGAQTFFYLEDHTRENFTPILSHTHPQYRELPPSSYDFFYTQKPLFVVLKSSGSKAAGIQSEDIPILVKNNDLARLFAPNATPGEQRSFEDIVIDIAKQRLKKCPDLLEAFLYYMVNHPVSLTGGVSRWKFEFINQQRLTSLLTPPEIKITARNEFIINKIDDWLQEYQDEHGATLTIQPINLGTPSQQKRSNGPQREDLLTPIINKLQSECTDPFSTAELWPKLIALASQSNPQPPIISYSEGRINWEKDAGIADHLSKEALAKRLKRLRQKNDKCR